MSLLSVEDLHVQFWTQRGTVYAVNGISFEVSAGETLGIVVADARLNARNRHAWTLRQNVAAEDLASRRGLAGTTGSIHLARRAYPAPQLADPARLRHRH